MTIQTASTVAILIPLVEMDCGDIARVVREAEETTAVPYRIIWACKSEGVCDMELRRLEQMAIRDNGRPVLARFEHMRGFTSAPYLLMTDSWVELAPGWFEKCIEERLRSGTSGIATHFGTFVERF
jgi:hypothetical protein